MYNYIGDVWSLTTRKEYYFPRLILEEKIARKRSAEKDRGAFSKLAANFVSNLALDDSDSIYLDLVFVYQRCRHIFSRCLHIASVRGGFRM